MHHSFILIVLLISSQQVIASFPQSWKLASFLSNTREYPYVVSIMDSGAHICGGSIIRPQTILTAGHCTYGRNATNLSIRAGSDSRTSGGVVIRVNSYLIHPSFRKRDLSFDIALVFLGDALPVDSANKIGVIPLYRERVPSRRIVVTAGWGTVYEGGQLVDTLRSTSFKTVPWRICRRIFEGGLTRSMFCAGVMNGDKDTCQGDSGGPLVMDKWLVGITSHGNGCGRKGYPGIYTSVPLLRRWIEQFSQS